MLGLKRFVRMLYLAQDHEGVFRFRSPRVSVAACEIDDICGPINWTDASVLETLSRWRLSYDGAGLVRGICLRKQQSVADSLMDTYGEQSRGSDKMPEQLPVNAPTFSIPGMVVTLRDTPLVRRLLTSSHAQEILESRPEVPTVAVEEYIDAETDPLPDLNLPDEATPLATPTFRRRKNVIMSDESDSESSTEDSEDSEDSSNSDILECFGYSDYLSVDDVELIRFQKKSYWPLVRTIAFLTSSPSANDNAAARKILADMPGKFKNTKAKNMYVIDTTKAIALRNCLRKRNMLDTKAWSKFCKHNNIQSAIRTPSK